MAESFFVISLSCGHNDDGPIYCGKTYGGYFFLKFILEVEVYVVVKAIDLPRVCMRISRVRTQARGMVTRWKKIPAWILIFMIVGGMNQCR